MAFLLSYLDPNETAEQCLIREIKEELNIDVGELEYLCTSPNNYLYKGIPYTSCDVYFRLSVQQTEFDAAEDEIMEYVWLKPLEVNLDEFAFSSSRDAIKVYLNRLSENVK